MPLSSEDSVEVSSQQGQCRGGGELWPSKAGGGGVELETLQVTGLIGIAGGQPELECGGQPLPSMSGGQGGHHSLQSTT